MLDKYQNIRMIVHNFHSTISQKASVHCPREPKTSKKARSSASRQELLGCSCIFSAGDLPNSDQGSRQLKKTALREDLIRHGLVGLSTKSLTACIGNLLTLKPRQRARPSASFFGSHGHISKKAHPCITARRHKDPGPKDPALVIPGGDFVSFNA
jgi:hypothetical protein